MSKLLKPLFEQEALIFNLLESRKRYVSHRLAGATISEAVGYTQAVSAKDEPDNANNLADGA